MKREHALTGLLFAMTPIIVGEGGAPPKMPTAPAVELSTMVAFEAATFRMGIEPQTASAYGDAWFVDQQPAHDVSLSMFHIDAHEVTVEAYAQFLTHAAGEYHFHPDQRIERVDGGFLPIEGAGDHPITHVTWEAALHFCRWAGKELPTEAQWEYAAAGQEGRTHPWGHDPPTCLRSNFFDTSSYCHDGPLPVGSNAEGATIDGVHDLAGNVSEWVLDHYDWYTGEARVDPRGPAEGSYRVVRGGGYLESSLALRTRARRAADPTRRSSQIGFRCAFGEQPPDTELRGSLSVLADEGRVLSETPLAPAANGAELLLEGLIGPTRVVELDGVTYVLEQGAGRIVSLDGATLFEGLDDPRDMAAGGEALFVTEATGVRRITSAGVATMGISGLSDAQEIVAAQDAFYTSYEDGIADATGPVAVVTGVLALALTPEVLLYTTGGGAARGISRITLATGLRETLIYASELEQGHDPLEIAVGDDDVVYFIQRLNVWPRSGSLCSFSLGDDVRLERLAISCLSHTPWYPRHLSVGPDGVFWNGRDSLVFLGGSDFVSIAPWTRGGGMLLTEGAVTWSDQLDGRLYRLAW